MTATVPSAVGQPLDRVDGPAKVSGSARYSAEIPLPAMAHAYVVGSRIAAGRVTGIDTSAALAEEGVLAVLTHQTLPKIAEQPPLIPSLAGTAAPGQTFFPLQDDTVHYAGQPIALVVADTWERAQYAARLLRVSYAQTQPVTTLDQGRDLSYEPERIFGGWVPGRIERGNVEAGLREADVRVEGTYTYAANNHNPIEPSCTTAQWDGDNLLLYDATQGVNATQMTVSRLLGVPMSKIRVIGHYAGGSFGCKAMIHAHPTLAAMAARAVGRPVKLVLTREQMFTSVGHREEQEQHLTLGATRDGRLTAVRHHKLSPTSHFDDWAEPSVGVSSQIYACPHYEGVYRLFRANTMTPTFMRAPGEASGMYALECSLDELAHELGIDPIALRLRNHTDVDAMTGLPWSSSGLKECYERGARRFGWAGRRSPAGHPQGRELADRYRHGHRLLPGPPARQSPARPRASLRRRHGGRPGRHPRLRHGRGHGDDPGRRGRPRTERGPLPLRERRHRPAQHRRRGGLGGRRHDQRGRAQRGHRAAPAAHQERRR